jgi:hypothetical protein
MFNADMADTTAADISIYRNNCSLRGAIIGTGTRSKCAQDHADIIRIDGINNHVDRLADRHKGMVKRHTAEVRRKPGWHSRFNVITDNRVEDLWMRRPMKSQCGVVMSNSQGRTAPVGRERALLRPFFLGYFPVTQDVPL